MDGTPSTTSFERMPALPSARLSAIPTASMLTTLPSATALRSSSSLAHFSSLKSCLPAPTDSSTTLTLDDPISTPTVVRRRRPDKMPRRKVTP
ncbi:hypothetical protein D3C87_1981740 [compost metagenome]